MQLVVSGQIVATFPVVQSAPTVVTSTIRCPMGLVGTGALICFGVADDAGNVMIEGGSQSIGAPSAIIGFDTVAPAIPSLSVSSSIVSANTLCVTLVGRDCTQLVVSVNGQCLTRDGIGDAPIAVTVNTLVPGVNYISACAIDSLANASDWSSVQTVTWDVNPITTLEITPSGWVSANTVILSGRMSKPIVGPVMAHVADRLQSVEISDTQWRVSIPVPNGYSGPLTVLIPGIHDMAGYQTSVTWNGIVDRLPPVATVPEPVVVGAGSASAGVSINEPVSIDSVLPDGLQVLNGSSLTLIYPITDQQPQGPVTVSIRVHDAAGNPFVITGQPWRVDTIAPTLTWVSPPGHPVSTGDLTVTLSVTEWVSTPSITLGDAPLSVTSRDGYWVATIPVRPGDMGTYTLSGAATDRVGNVGRQVLGTLRIDTQAPTIDGLPSPRYASAIDFTVTASESIASLTAQANGRDMASERLSDRSYRVWVPSTFPDGDYDLTLNPTDLAGNRTSMTSSHWRLDRIPPQITAWRCPSSVGVGRMTLDAEFSEDIASISVTVDGIPMTEVAREGKMSRFDLSIPRTARNGDVPVQVIAMDPAGNTASSTMTITIDTTAPTCQGITARSPQLIAGPVQFGVRFSEPVTVNHAAIGPVTLERDMSVSTASGEVVLMGVIPSDSVQGPVALTLDVSDRVGNGMVMTQAGYFIDTIRPELETMAPLIHQRVGAWSTAMYLSERVATATATLNGRPVAVGVDDRTLRVSGVVSADDPQGLATLVVELIDDAGNRSTQTSSPIYIDTIAPRIGRMESEPAVKSVGPWMVRFPISEEVSTASATISGHPTSVSVVGSDVILFGVITTADAQGPVIAHLRVTDVAGNVAESTESIMTIDTQGAHIVALPEPISRGEGPWQVDLRLSESVVTASAICNDKPVAVTVAGDALRLVGGITPDDPQGLATLRVTMEDLAHNSSTQSFPLAIVDTIRPVIGGGSAPVIHRAGPWSVTLSVSEAVSSASVVLNERPMAVTTSDRTLTIVGDIATSDVQGPATMMVTVSDAAGNWASMATVPVIIDTVPPSLKPIITAVPHAAGPWEIELQASETIASASALLWDHPVDVRIDGQALWVTSLITPTDRQGLATVSVTLLDRAGNTANVTLTPLIIDTIQPELGVHGLP
ncbi:hypothetical protein EB093_08180, partial [bacterium]|nr:hypothetical protein [bacterium]